MLIFFPITTQNGGRPHIETYSMLVVIDRIIQIVLDNHKDILKIIF